MVNETKVTSTNTFVVNLFAFESNTESKNDKTTLFPDFPRILDQPVNLDIPNATYMWFSAVLVLAFRWPLPVAFIT